MAGNGGFASTLQWAQPKNPGTGREHFRVDRRASTLSGFLGSSVSVKVSEVLRY